MTEFATSSRVLDWPFPLPRTHCGIPLANGTQGVLVWGEEALHLTVARAGFWDHQGGNPFTAKATFAKVRALLEANDEPGITEVFAVPGAEGGGPDRPQQLGGGRIELHFGRGFVPVRGQLNPQTAALTVTLRNPAGKEAAVVIRQSMNDEIIWIELQEPAYGPVEVRCRPTWEWTHKSLEARGVTAPAALELSGGGGFVQDLPEDDSLGLAWRRVGDHIVIATHLHAESERAAAEAVAKTAAAPEHDSSGFWESYWRSVPRVELPDSELQHFWDLALFKQAGLTTPGAVAATLQGPWMEEYRLPPWSNDYHFNINIQMIYWPVLATNRLSHFQPLWDLIRGWMPKLQENGEKFFGAPGALMLPHAVDDRCQVVGTFWTGTIDHACTAWMAQMAWLHYRYGLDESILRDLAWPLLNGAFEGYWAMLEEYEGRLSMPVSVSPEYRGSAMNAWGRDASFQLAALHCVTQILPRAAALLGQPVDSRWQEVTERLPAYTTINGRIALWEGLELEESHRHHSYLASIFPFCSIDPFAPEHWSTVARSIEFWNQTGAGLWTGWCIPWAATLCARLELPDAAVTWLHWLLDNYTNEGWGTLHNSDFPGAAAWSDGSLYARHKPENNEIMQMDAGMGFLTAITELLVQNRGDVITVLPALPRRWKTLRFDGIRAEGAFLVSATVESGRLAEVRVRSEKGGKLRLAHGLGETYTMNGVMSWGELLEYETKAGETVILTAA